jgi:hypothetical protein
VLNALTGDGAAAVVMPLKNSRNAAAAAGRLLADPGRVLDAEHPWVGVGRNKRCVDLRRLVGRVADLARHVTGLDEHRAVRRARPYAIGERSSRRIERRCHEDVAVRVITANQAPDHTTIARFRQRHEQPLGELFGDVLELCAEAGLGHVEVVAVDGTKVHAKACQHANRDYERIAREALEQAAGTDRVEDERFRDRRGDELPPEMANAQGRRGWLREAKRRLDERRAEQARPIPASRSARLKEAKRRPGGGAVDRVPGQRGL